MTSPIKETPMPDAYCGEGPASGRPIVFLGGIFLPGQAEEVQSLSQGPVQYAADALQKALLRGLAEVSSAPVKAVNLPFVGSYPKNYQSPWFPARSGEYPLGVPVDGKRFLNLRFVKFLFRFWVALSGLRTAVPRDQPSEVLVYSSHLPFLAAARILRWQRPKVRLSIILPDLPEFMGVGGRLYHAVKAIESSIFRMLIPGFDNFVLLTKAMGDRLGIPPERYVVVEGIYDPIDDSSGEEVDHTIGGDDFPILYTGTLAARYGIGDLLDAFERLALPQARLWVCGDGDTRSRVEAFAARDSRVRYFGTVPRRQALALQRQAAVLVNPRRPDGEFTKYSFPSKTMEYLASGKPVVMHALPGMPEKYLEHLILPCSPDANGLAEALLLVARQSTEWREARGMAGRRFILSEKTPSAQVTRVLNLISSIDKLKTI